MAIFFVYPTEKYHSAYSPNAQYEEKNLRPHQLILDQNLNFSKFFLSFLLQG
jgi:hypothetical protein